MYTKILEDMLLDDFLLEIENKVLGTINEELGVASEVITMSDLVYKQLQNNVNTSQSLPFNGDGVTFKKGMFAFVYKKYNFNVLWNFYWYRNMETYNKFPRHRGASYNKGTNRLSINVIRIGNKDDKINILEAIQHEIEHYFEGLHRGFRPYKDEKMYHCVLSYLNDNDKDTSVIANIIYLSFKFEHRAFANGLYQVLYNNNCHTFDVSVLKTTQVYNGLLKLKNDIKYLENIQNISDNAKQLLTKLKLTKDECISIAYNTIDELMKKIGRTIAKVKNDLIRQGILHEHFEFYTIQDAIRDGYYN